MKKFLISACLAMIVNVMVAQSPYISLQDKNHPEQHILNGIITKYALQNDPDYKWYMTSQNSYTPADPIVGALQEAKDKVQYIVFGGTWCEDTQFVLPKFFKLQEASGVLDNKISFFAVDRNKKTIGGIADAFKITNVPTIIVMKDGKELGRVVEYGSTGAWDKELAALLN